MAIRAGQNHPDIRPEGCGFLDDIMTRSTRNRHVEQNQINSATFRMQEFDRRRTIRNIEYVEAIVTEHFSDCLSQLILIFHNQDSDILRPNSRSPSYGL